MLVIPIDELHEEYIGFKLSSFNSPQFASAIMCPHEKFNWVISVNLQHKHLVLPISSPIHFDHTFLFNVVGIDFFFGLFTTILFSSFLFILCEFFFIFSSFLFVLCEFFFIFSSFLLIFYLFIFSFISNMS
jgi:hypothetical protein